MTDRAELKLLCRIANSANQQDKIIPMNLSLKVLQ